MPARRYHAFRVARIIVLAALALCGQPEAHAQQAVLSVARNLDFGSFVAGSGGTIILSPSGARSKSGGVILLPSVGAGQAIINIGRNANGRDRGISFSLPPSGSVRLTSGANSMAVNVFVSNPPTSPSAATPSTMSIGATLVVAPNQPPGQYTGTFNVTVNLN